jgi:coniferyl-aldehyde dehydrogenase
LEHVVAATVSGGITVNGASLHAATLNMGFGGVGASGMGRHHGVEGFREFSNLRAVFVRGDEREPLVIFPPYREAAQAAVDFLFPADAECAA